MASWAERSVLVTGGTGLVGSWLVNRLLNEGAKVTCLVLDSDPSSELIRSKNIEKVCVVNGNLADIDAVSRAVNHQSCDTIFHLGAQTIVGTAFSDPIDTFRSNIQGTWNLLEVARRSNGLVKRLLVASSDKAYGSSKVLPYTEDMQLHGSGPYDVSKSATDLLSQSYGKTYGLPVVVLQRVIHKFFRMTEKVNLLQILKHHMGRCHEVAYPLYKEELWKSHKLCHWMQPVISLLGH